MKNIFLSIVLIVIGIGFIACKTKNYKVLNITPSCYYTVIKNDGKIVLCQDTFEARNLTSEECAQAIAIGRKKASSDTSIKDSIVFLPCAPTQLLGISFIDAGDRIVQLWGMVRKGQFEVEPKQYIFFVNLENEKILNWIVVDSSSLSKTKSREEVHFSTVEELLPQLQNKYESSIIAELQALEKEKNQVINFIDLLREEMVERSGGYATEGKYKGKPANFKDIDTPQQIFITEKKGIKLKQKLIHYAVAAQTFKDKISCSEAFILEKPWEGTRDEKTWEEFTFGYMPIAALYPLFRKYQNEVESTMQSILSHCMLKN